MDRIKALAPVEFRFTEPEDVAAYGDQWYRYAEADLIRTPARQLIELEAELQMPLVDVMNGMRMHTALGDLAAAWLGVRAVDPKLAGPFDDFNPMALAITWRPSQAEGKEPAAPAAQDTPPPPDAGSQPETPSEPVTSETTDSVVLPVSPAVA